MSCIRNLMRSGLGSGSGRRAVPCCCTTSAIQSTNRMEFCDFRSLRVYTELDFAASKRKKKRRRRKIRIGRIRGLNGEYGLIPFNFVGIARPYFDCIVLHITLSSSLRLPLLYPMDSRKAAGLPQDAGSSDPSVYLDVLRLLHLLTCSREGRRLYLAGAIRMQTEQLTNCYRINLLIKL